MILFTHPKLFRAILLDAVRSCEDVRGINERSSADVNIVVLLLLQDCRLELALLVFFLQSRRFNFDTYLPRVLAEFCIALVVLLGGVVDPAGDAVSVPLPALSVGAELASVDNTVELLRLLPDISDGAGRSKLVEIKCWR